jgi:hypothetical protein
MPFDYPLRYLAAEPSLFNRAVGAMLGRPRVDVDRPLPSPGRPTRSPK